MPWRCGRVCPGPRLAIGPGGRDAALTDSNGDRLMRAGLGPSFGTITTLAGGSTEQFGLPLWSRTGNRLYVFGRMLSLVPGGTGRPAPVRKDPDPPQALALSPDGKRLFSVDAAGTVRIGALRRCGHGVSGRRFGGCRSAATGSVARSRGRAASGRTPASTSARPR